MTSDVVAGDADAERPPRRERELRAEHDVVDPAVRDERDRRREQDDVQETGGVAEQPVRDDLERRSSGPSRRSILPRRTISQQCSNIRTLRRYSVSFVGVGFSHACAAGS